MKNTIVATMIGLSACLAGCALTSSNMKPASYDARHSRAYNIAHAGGLVTGISDSKIAKDELKRLTDTKTFGAAYTLSGYISPNLGMTNWQGGALNMLNWAIGPKQHGARSSLVAWMPENEATNAKEAQNKMLSHVKAAIAQTFEGMGVKFELLYDKGGVLGYYFYNNDWGCPEWVKGYTSNDMCSVDVRVVTPGKASAPVFIAHASYPSFAFTSEHGVYYNKIKISNGKGSRVPQQRFYADLSKNLPSWAFLYLAPKQVELQSGEKVAFPYLLEKGLPEFFVYPVE